MPERPSIREDLAAVQLELGQKAIWIKDWESRVRSAFHLDDESLNQMAAADETFGLLGIGQPAELSDGSKWLLNLYKGIKSNKGPVDILQFEQVTANDTHPKMARLFYADGSNLSDLAIVTAGWGIRSTVIYEIAEMQDQLIVKLARATQANVIFKLLESSRLLPPEFLTQQVEAYFGYQDDKLMGWQANLELERAELKLVYSNGHPEELYPILESIGFPKALNIMPHIANLFKESGKDPLC